MSPVVPPPLVMDASLDLLAKAALAPLDVARDAWSSWCATYDIDTTPWNEVRMLGAVAARIDALDPDSAIRPRVLGIRKFLWVQSQICLKQCENGLAALQRTGIPMMLMKGAARTARDPQSVQERLIRDVDLLVPLPQQQQAFEALKQAGWSIDHAPWQVRMHAFGPISSHHAWSFSRGKSEIDLHHFSNHLNRLTGDDDGLWSRVTATEWQGKSVFIPSAADALLIALIHGVRWSQDKSADWTVDACALLDQETIDWDVFLAEASTRQIQAHLFTGLRYLQEALDKPIPNAVMPTLQAGITAEQCEELAYYSTVDAPKTVAQGQLATRMAWMRTQTPAPGNSPAGKVEHPVKSQGHLVAESNQWLRFPLYDMTKRQGWMEFTLLVDRTEQPELEQLYIEVMWPGLHSSIARFDVPARTSSLLSVHMPEALLALRSIRTLAVRMAANRPSRKFGLAFTVGSLAAAPSPTVPGHLRIQLLRPEPNPIQTA